MKKISLSLFLFFLAFEFSFAQKTSLQVTFKHSSDEVFTLFDYRNTFETDFPGTEDREIELNAQKSANVVLKLDQAGFFGLACKGRNDKEFLFYSLFIEPGNQIRIQVDFSKPNFGILVSGKGAENNQPAIAWIKKEFGVGDFSGDTTPNRAVHKIKLEEIKRKNAFNAYIKTYKPSQKFIQATWLNLKYFAANAYFSFQENNKFGIQEAYIKNLSLWEKVQDSLFKAENLNNNAAIYTPNYLDLIRNFLGRKKEKLWALVRTDPEKFSKEWYNAKPEEALLAFSDDPTNLLEEKIIQAYFNGPSAEILYMHIFDDAIDESEYKNIPIIFERFKTRFPESKYIAWLQPYVDAYLKREQKPLTDQMVFARNNGTDLNTLEEVLALNKGKTLLLDMWGTWCGPCRSELETNGQAIKDHFKGKGLDYLYIANRDLRNEGTWRKLIPYFNMEGLHILANPALSDDIMDKVKGTGYPTYVIIKKDGSYELSKAGYPMDREVLIKQLEEALAQ